MEIATSILSSKDRIKSVQELNHTYSSYIHVDVMDGKFVSDVQFDTYEKIHSIHLVAKKPMDIHLMVDNPMEYIIQLSHMNIAFITFHLEIKKNIKEIIDKIHSMGYKASIAIKPSTDINKLTPFLDDIDMILVMCVEPGAGGRKFIPNSVDRIQEVKELIKDKNILVEVDGGINGETIDKVRDVDIAVVGSYIINSDSYKKTIESLLFSNELLDSSEIKDKKPFGNFLDSLFVLLLFYFILLILLGAFSMFFGTREFTLFGFESDIIYGIEAFADTVGVGLMLLNCIIFLFFPLPLLVLCLLVFFVKFIISKSKIIIKRSFLYTIVIGLYFLMYCISMYFN